MPKFYDSIESHNRRTATWKQRLDTIGREELPEDMKTLLENNNEKNVNPKDKYSRFTTYIKGWILEASTFDSSAKNILLPEESGGCGIKCNELPDDWWEIAIDLGKTGGEHADMPPSPLVNEDEDVKTEGRGKIYDKLLPTYAALRESHNNRPWYQWITNHAQYTAERDSMHALRGMILVLTGYCKETFDREYNEYRAELAAKSEENIQEPKEAVSDDKRIKFSVNDIDKINEKDNSIKIEEKHEELNKSIPIPDDSYISNF